MMEEPTCPPTPPLSKCPDTPPPAGTSKWDSPDRKEKSRSPTPNRPTSPERCAICLGALSNKSFTNSCCHQFCFVCLLEWSKVKAECPLCKVAFNSIIHNVRSQDDYDQYHVVRQSPPRPSLQSVLLWERSRFQRSMPYHHQAFSEWMVNRGLTRLRTPPEGYGNGFSYEAIPQGPPARHIPRWNPNGTSAFRRSIYDRDLWARPQPDITGRYRDCSPEFYSQNPAQMHRLLPFLNRELNVLLDNGARTMYIIEKIFELLPLYNMTSTMFRSQVARLIGHRHAPHFCHELRMFASSPYDLVGYDRNVQYHPSGGAGVSIEIEESSDSNNGSEDEDDDIQIIESGADTRSQPSTSTGAVGSSRDIHPSMLHHSAVVNVSSDSESDDTGDIQVLDVIKPRHERTPELITLSSPEHPGASSPRSNPSMVASRSSYSPNLICISLGSNATAHHTWQDGVNDISSDGDSINNILRDCVVLRPVVSKLHHRALGSSSESSQSPSSSDEDWNRTQRKRVRSKRSAKSKSRKHSKGKLHKQTAIRSDSEEESQPSTSRGRPTRKHRTASKSTPTRCSKRSKNSVSPPRTLAESDSDHSHPRIRSTIVQPSLSRRLSSSDDEDDDSQWSTVRSKVVVPSTSEEGRDSWKVVESNSSPVKEERPHSSGYNSSQSPTHHKHSKHQSKDQDIKKHKHTHNSRRSNSSHSPKNGKKRRDRSPESHVKKSKRKALSSSESDGVSKATSRKRKSVTFSDSD